jgi:hypothetical protein
MSNSGASQAARSTSRPMRPKPLIATRFFAVPSDIECSPNTSGYPDMSSNGQDDGQRAMPHQFAMNLRSNFQATLGTHGTQLSRGWRWRKGPLPPTLLGRGHCERTAQRSGPSAPVQGTWRRDSCANRSAAVTRGAVRLPHRRDSRQPPIDGVPALGDSARSEHRHDATRRRLGLLCSGSRSGTAPGCSAAWRRRSVRADSGLASQMQVVTRTRRAREGTSPLHSIPIPYRICPLCRWSTRYSAFCAPSR